MGFREQQFSPLDFRRKPGPLPRTQALSCSCAWARPPWRPAGLPGPSRAPPCQPHRGRLAGAAWGQEFILYSVYGCICCIWVSFVALVSFLVFVYVLLCYFSAWDKDCGPLPLCELWGEKPCSAWGSHPICPISLLRLSLAKFIDSNLAGNSVMTWEFHTLRS